MLKITINKYLVKIVFGFIYILISTISVLLACAAVWVCANYPLIGGSVLWLAMTYFIGHVLYVTKVLRYD